MNKKEFENLQIGDYVQLNCRGLNRGKIARVLKRIDYRHVLIEPHNCVFDFGSSKKEIGNGLCAFNYESLKRLGSSPIAKTKTFYIAEMFGTATSWPTTNFNDTELKVIGRFLKELNENINCKTVDVIHILDGDDDE